MSTDLKQATVWWIVPDDALIVGGPPISPADAQRLLEAALQSRCSELRNKIGRRLTLRHIPRLAFCNDSEAVARAAAVDAVLGGTGVGAGADQRRRE